METADVVFDFRLPEFGILLLALFLIYGITWAKDLLERNLRTPKPAAAVAGAAQQTVDADEPEPSDPTPAEPAPTDPADGP